MPGYKKHLFVCQNLRDENNPKGSCSRSGADALLDALKGRVHQEGIQGDVRVNAAGCLNAWNGWIANGEASVMIVQSILRLLVLLT